MKKLIIIIILTFTPKLSFGVAAGLAGTASIIPGLGQVLDGEPLEGLSWFAVVVGTIGSGNALISQAGFDLLQYNMYDAYRDAKPTINRYTQYSVFQNYLATFNPVNLFDPIGAPIVGLGAAAGAHNHYPATKYGTSYPYYAFVGLGEEGLFRGFLFPAFSDVFNSKFFGAFTSSAIFSFVHVTGGRKNLGGFILIERFLLGMLFCWQADNNKYDLRHGIFAHAWFDILVEKGSTASSIPLGIKLNIPF